MRLPTFQLSAPDQALMTEVLVARHPDDVGPMALGRVPKGAALERVLALYNVEGEREQWIDCQLCGHSNNHKHGFVGLFADHGKAAFGRDWP